MARTLRRIPIRRVANRHNLFMGGDRELMMLSALCNAALVLTAINWLATAVGGLLWTISIVALRRMAKADPQMRRVYWRQRRYKTYYPARSTPWRENSAAPQGA